MLNSFSVDLRYKRFVWSNNILGKFLPRESGSWQARSWNILPPFDCGSTLAAFQRHWAVTTFNPLRPGLSHSELQPYTGFSLVWHFHTGLTRCLFRQAPWLTQQCWSLPTGALAGCAEACCAWLLVSVHLQGHLVTRARVGISPVGVVKHAWFHCVFWKLWCSFISGKVLKWGEH